jgi:hypothetical protein
MGLRRSGVVAVAGLALVLGAAAHGATPQMLNLALSGSVKGGAVSGKVQFASVMCAPLTKGVQVNWNGDAKVGSKMEQVSGSFQFSSTGRSSFAAGGATASLVVGGDYSGSLGSGVSGGGGTGSVPASKKSGTVNFTVVNGSSKVREKGNWVCG